MVVEILPNLYISDILSSKNKTFMKKYNIRLVITCNKDFYKKSENTIEDNIEYINIPLTNEINDTNISLLYNSFDKINNIINRYIKNLTSILICSYNPYQEVSILVASYIMKYSNITDIGLLSYYIRTKSPNSFMPINNYSKSLELYSKNINL